ncbi:hypothetical protein ACHAPX_010579 [Trichoderma viride]
MPNVDSFDASLEKADSAKTKSEGLILYDDNPYTPEIIPIESQNFHGPGILSVTIYEGLGFTAPSEYEEYEPNLLPGTAAKTQARDSILQNANYQKLPHAVLEFDNSQIHIKAVSGTTESPVWNKERGSILPGKQKFDVFRASDLTIRLYIKHLHARSGNQHIFLGAATITPVFEPESTSQTKWLQLGTGKLHVKVEYATNKTLQIRTTKPAKCYRDRWTDSISRVWKWDSRSCYASINIQKSVDFSHGDVVQALISPVNNNPFIAPLKFAAQAERKLCLFWPFISGGYLLYHLQMARHFQIDRARFYAAEILVALECLHAQEPSYSLDPSDLFLDSIGHVVLCDPHLLHLNMGYSKVESDITEDCIAPELLSDNESTSTTTTASKWWTLGALLYEMLTGLPPFYSEDVQERRRNILSKPLEMNNLLPAYAQDLIAKLLIRNPNERLGSNGPSEIKSHPFFGDIDWTKVLRREYEPAFNPPELIMSFAHCRQHTMEEIQARLMEEFKDFEWERPERPTALLLTEPVQPAVVPATKESHPTTVQPSNVDVERKEDWELVWRVKDQMFYFFNRSTSAQEPIAAPQQKHMPPTKPSQAILSGHQDEEADKNESSDANIHELPDEAQKQSALDEVLKMKYFHLVPELLKNYVVNLNFDLNFSPRKTPLEYATELEDVNIVELFLENGADANFTSKHGGRLPGPALLYAVRQGNHQLVEMLIQKTDRVHCTRALGHAITKRDLPIIDILLANGVRCDFEDSDRQLSPMSRDYEGGIPLDTWNMTSDVDYESVEYLPPLVRAVIVGDKDLVRLLLVYGADVNIGFHGLKESDLPGLWRADVSCGRPIQLALELEHHNLVQVLLDNGADIDMAQPVSQDYNCKMIPRVAYYQIVSRLRSISLSATAAK